MANRFSKIIVVDENYVRRKFKCPIRYMECHAKIHAYNLVSQIASKMQILKNGKYGGESSFPYKEAKSFS